MSIRRIIYVVLVASHVSCAADYDSRRASELALVMNELRGFATGWVLDHEEGHSGFEGELLSEDILDIPVGYFSGNRHMEYIKNKSERCHIFRGSIGESGVVLLRASILLAGQNEEVHLSAEVDDLKGVLVRRIESSEVSVGNALLFSTRIASEDENL